MEAQYSLLLKNIGERIRTVRAAKGMSQTELAEMAQMSYSAINKFENGLTNIWLINFIKICEALQVSPDDLLRINTPAPSKNDYGELAELLNGCTPIQMASILRIVKEVKSSFDTQISE